MTQVRVAARTDVGRVRPDNEDAYLVALPLVAVADGMGGHNAGEVASSTALETLQAWKDSSPGPMDPQKLRAAVLAANEAILDKSRANPELEGMGTTLTAVWVEDGVAFLAHVGDSRAYLLRDGELQQLTEDQTLVRQWVDEGRIAAEEASVHPYRSVLLQALGVEANLDVELLGLELDPGDRLLLSTDGMHGPVDVDRITAVLAAEPDPDAAVDRLVAEANDGGGDDNITVVLVDAIDTGNPTTPREPGAPVIVSRPTSGKRRRARGSSFRRSHLLIALAGAVVILAGIAVALGWFADRSEYVVAARDGQVVILRGRPAAGTADATGDVVRVTDRRLDSLPDTYQRNVRTGIAAATLQEAEQIVLGLPRKLGPTELTTPAPSPPPEPPQPEP